MSIEAMKAALEALKRLNDIDGMYSWVDTEQALRQAIEQAEHPLDIYERAYFAGKQDGIDETESIAKLKERNNCEAGATGQTEY